MRTSQTHPERADRKVPERQSRAPADTDRWSDPEQRIMRAIARSSIHWRRFVL